MPSLFIVESPGKVKSIQTYLGNDYIVKASVGHIYQIEPKDNAIDIENNFTPRYIVISKKKQIIREIKALAKKCTKVYIGTDDDREGLAIGWQIAKFAIKDDDKIRRVIFQEVTKNAILNSVKQSISLDSQEDLYLSQQARAIVDRLVGYKVSPVLWRKVCKGTSAGRVQSIGLRLIVDRQAEIDVFIPEEYWSIKGSFNTSNNNILAIYKSSKKLTNEDQVNNIIVSIKKIKSWSVKDVTKARKKRSPYPVFNTSSLQQFCSSTFGWDGKKTMRIAQSLYEGAVINDDRTGLITYHRTDSINVSNEAINNVRDFITTFAGKDYIPKKPRVYKSKKAAQEAHEGIRPTHLEFNLQSIRQSVEDNEFKLYEAIYYRFIASQTVDALFDTTKIAITSDDTKHTFTTSGQILVFDGFLKFWKYSSVKDECLPELSKDDILKLIKVNGEQHFTKPPAAYNTASLVKTLEEQGIGRPSTYATIISTLLKRTYIEKEGKAFKPTDLGKSICAYLVSSFPELLNTNYTARLEDKLDEIAQGNKVWHKIVGKFFDELTVRLDAAKDSVSMKSKDTDILCPECQTHNLVKRRSKYGWFYGCAGFSVKGKDKCRATFQIGSKDEPVKKEKKEVKYIEGVTCDKCNSPIVIRKGKKLGTEFGGCSKFPHCKRTFSLDGEPIQKTFRKRK